MTSDYSSPIASENAREEDHTTDATDAAATTPSWFTTATTET